MAKRKLINTGMVEGKFFTKKDFAFDIKLGREYLNTDIPATVLLYRIDRVKTKTNNIYGETRASEKVTYTPVELQVKLSVEENENDYLGDSTIPKHWAGKLVFTIYEDELTEKNVDIKRGDFIGLQNAKDKLTYYEVNDADIMNVSNNKTIGGLGSYYKKITCFPVDRDVFAG
jgi:hypothetical protein